jgi:hypothetical protein
MPWYSFYELAVSPSSSNRINRAQSSLRTKPSIGPQCQRWTESRHLQVHLELHKLGKPIEKGLKSITGPAHLSSVSFANSAAAALPAATTPLRPMIAPARSSACRLTTPLLSLRPALQELRVCHCWPTAAPETRGWVAQRSTARRPCI